MAYLILADYKKIIQNDNLSQVIGNDYTQVTLTEQRAQQELVSYLVQKYDLAKELTNTDKWSYGVVRKAKDRVYLDATAYSSTINYALNSLTLFNGKVYRCSTAIVTPEPFTLAKWTLLGTQFDLFYIKTPQPDWDYYKSYEAGELVFFDDKVYTAYVRNVGRQPDINSPIWGTGVAYSVPSNIYPTDVAYYIAGDNRNQQIVGAIIDICLYHLHSRIAPHNIPALRYDRYKDIKEWLKNCAKGDDYTLDVPRIKPLKGQRNMYGSTQTKSNNNI